MTNEEIKKRISLLQSKADKVSDKIIRDYEKQLILAYKNSLEEIKKQIAGIYEKYGDEVTYGQMQTYNRLATLEKDIALQLKELTNENIKIITKVIKENFIESYYRTGYAIEVGSTIKMGFGQLNKKVIESAVLNPLDYIKWPDRLKENVINKYLNSIRQELTQGLIQGKGYYKIAKGIVEKTQIATNKSILIARTEGGRARSTAKILAYDKTETAAERLGIKTTRIWVATLDNRTRDSHRIMDGQTATENANGDLVFILPSGAETEGPRLSGIAEEDIQCRCTTIISFEDIPYKYRRDNSEKDTIKNYTFQDWLKDKNIKIN